MKYTDNQLNKEFGELNSQTQSVYNSLVEDTDVKDNTGAKSVFGDIEAAWSDVAGFAQKHEKALIIAGAAIALIAVGIATCGVGDAVLATALGMGAIGAGTGLAGEEISDYMDDGKIDNTDQSYLGTAAGGFVTGALIPVGGTEAVGLKGIAAAAGKNALGSMIGNATGQEISTGKINYTQVAETGLFAGVLSGASTVAAGALKSSVINTASEDLENTGLNQETVDKILSTPKGQRPDPSTYLSKEYINSHLSEFENGVTKIMPQAPKGTVGPLGGGFVMSKTQADELITQSNGDIPKLEELLGFDNGYLNDNPVRVDISSPNGLRMPSGNEIGANTYWQPGGFTSGGIKEAVIDPAPKGTYTVSSIK